MQATGVEILDSSIERTAVWLRDLMQELNWNNRRRAYLTLRCVLHGIRDHLSVEDAVRFANSFPVLLRGAYFENYDPIGKPLLWQSPDEFISSLCAYALTSGTPPAGAEPAVRAVLRLLERKAVLGEIESLSRFLPVEFRDRWSDIQRAA